MSPVAPLPLASVGPTGVQTVKLANNPGAFVLDVPFRSQYDGSPYQDSNCGPASLAMVFAAYGISVTNAQLRAVADKLQGTTSYDSGVAIDYLQAMAQEAGLRTEGLTAANGHYRKWSLVDVAQELQRGYPVITLVHYATLPDHAGSTSTSDHYIVVVGVSNQGFIVNDPAFTGNGGFRRQLSSDQLMQAWSAASIPDQAVAILPPIGQPNLGRLLAVGNGPRLVPTVAPARSLASAPPVNSQQIGVLRGPVVAPSPAASVARSAGSALSADADGAWQAQLSQLTQLSRWQHLARPTPVVLARIAAPTRVAARPSAARSERSPSGAPLPLLGVAALIVVGAMVILKEPWRRRR